MRSRAMGSFAVASLLAFACGCGGSDTSGLGDAGGIGGPMGGAGGAHDAGVGTGDDAAPSRCTVALSGTVTTTIPCSRAYVVWSANASAWSTFIMDGLEPNFAHDFKVSIEVPDKPMLKTYTSADPGADQYSYVKVSENLTGWSARGGPDGYGSYALTFTALGPETQGSDVRWHEVQGSLQATLTGTTGEVAFAVTF